ncbi:MAG: hypothetical protein IJE92_05925 [Clostridia bacterium]|nr:hypothetical protein [Clostridia bacterium]
MSDTILVAVISLLGTLVGSLTGILTANKLTNYRIQELEKKVEKHNNLISRTFILEEKLNADEKRLEKIEKKVSE